MMQSPNYRLMTRVALFLCLVNFVFASSDADSEKVSKIVAGLRKVFATENGSYNPQSDVYTRLDYAERLYRWVFGARVAHLNNLYFGAGSDVGIISQKHRSKAEHIFRNEFMKLKLGVADEMYLITGVFAYQQQVLWTKEDGSKVPATVTDLNNASYSARKYVSIETQETFNIEEHGVKFSNYGDRSAACFQLNGERVISFIHAKNDDTVTLRIPHKVPAKELKPLSYYNKSKDGKFSVKNEYSRVGEKVMWEDIRGDRHKATIGRSCNENKTVDIYFRHETDSEHLKLANGNGQPTIYLPGQKVKVLLEEFDEQNATVVEDKSANDGDVAIRCYDVVTEHRNIKTKDLKLRSTDLESRRRLMDRLSGY